LETIIIKSRSNQKRGHLYVNIITVSKLAPNENDQEFNNKYDMYVGEDELVKHKNKKVIIIGELVDI